MEPICDAFEPIVSLSPSSTESDVLINQNTQTEAPSRFFKDIFVFTFAHFDIILRRAPETTFLVSKCGSWVLNDKYPHIMKHYGNTTLYTYLSIERCKIHRLVATAWVHNPSPTYFTWVDHIDKDTQNNHASNLRWISPSLNGLNRRRKFFKKMITTKGAVYFVSSMKIAGKETRKTSSTKKEAILTTKKMIRDQFKKAYDEYLALDDICRHTRAPHMLLWTDERVENTEGLVETGLGVRFHPEGRSAHFAI